MNDRQRRLVHGVMLVFGIAAMSLYEFARLTPDERRKVIEEFRLVMRGE